MNAQQQLGFALLLISFAVSASAIKCDDVPKPDNGKRCYICNAQEPISAANDKCINKPDNIAPGAACIGCSLKFCTIFRQEEKNTKKVVRFFRTCENELNKTLETSIDMNKYTVYYTKCTPDKCNQGDGSSDAIQVGDESFFEDGQNIIVPDIPPKSHGTSVVVAGKTYSTWALAFVALIFALRLERVPAILDTSGHRT